MRSEFQVIGKEVAGFESKLVKTNTNMCNLSARMETVATNQERYRAEARAADTKTNVELATFKEVQ